MLRILIFLIPILVNYSIGGMLFITAHRLAEAQAGSMVITGTAACWAFFYAATSLVAGKITTARNAGALILISFCGLFAGSLGFLLVPGLEIQFLWIAVSGIAMAFYCTPFQVYMKGFETENTGGIVASTCKYTGSWSFGMATGAFIFGLMGWRVGYLLIACAAVFMFLELLLVEILVKRGKNEAGTAVQSPASVKPEPEGTGKPDCILPVWFLGGCGTFVIFIVRTLEPALAVQLNISSGHAGAILALVSITQVLVSLFLIRCTRWYYSWKAVSFLGLAGFAGLMLFAFGKNCAAMYAGALIYGTHSGMFYLLFVYHALVHPENSSRYVSVNEAIVGGTTIAGCLLGGLIAQLFDYQTVFALSAVFILCSSLLAAQVIRRKMKEYCSTLR